MDKFRDNLKLTIIGFFLTGVVGSGLTFLFSYLQWRYTTEQSIRTARSKEAHELMLKTMDLCQSRFWASQRVVWAAESPKYYDLKEVEQDYLSAVKDWNMNLHATRVLITEYFGEQYASLLVDDKTLVGKPGGESIHASFIAFHKSAVPFLRTGPPLSSDDYSHMAEELTEVSQRLDAFYQAIITRYYTQVQLR